jgi:aldehyde:ferredoxin oxidoreductase
LSRLFNLREGFTAEDDKLPKRVQKAFANGPIAGKQLDDEDRWQWGKRRYYEMMDWDPGHRRSHPCRAGKARLGRITIGGVAASTIMQIQISDAR